MNETAYQRMRETFGYRTPMQMPRVQKIVVNMGFNTATGKEASRETLMKQLGLITGQRPIPTRAKKAISSFQIRTGDVVGLKVTLRGKRMVSFLMRLTRIVLPRLRDFRGLSRTSFDRHGHYTLGISDYTIFPEVEYKKGEGTHGMEVTIVTNAGSRKEAEKLLELLGMPFQKEKKG